MNIQASSSAEFVSTQATQVPVCELFNIPAPESVTVQVMPPHPLAPRTTENFIFRPQQLKLFMAFFCTDQAPNCGLYIHGPYGTGKTSSVREFCGRLNIPVTTFDWNYECEVQDLIGTRDIAFGDTTFTYGALAIAMREGYTLLINEIDRGRPSNLTGLHGILEGQSLYIKETNEIIEPHPNFRLVVTANSAGAGDATGTYTGSVRRQDPAFMDRFLVTACDYLAEAEEIDLIRCKFPSFDGLFVQAMVKFANETRTSACDTASPVTKPLSTRSLDRFFWLAQTFGLHNRPSRDLTVDAIAPAMEPAYLDRLDEDERGALGTVLDMCLRTASRP